MRLDRFAERTEVGQASECPLRGLDILGLAIEMECVLRGVDGGTRGSSERAQRTLRKGHGKRRVRWKIQAGISLSPVSSCFELDLQFLHVKSAGQSGELTLLQLT